MTMSSDVTQRPARRPHRTRQRDGSVQWLPPSQTSKRSWFWYLAIFVSHLTVIVFFFVVGALHAQSLRSSISARSKQAEDCPLDGEAMTRGAPMTDYFYSDGDARHPNDATKITLPSQTSAYIAGVARVSRIDLLQKLDYGFPLQASTSSNREVIILYDHRRSLPNGHNGRFPYYQDTLAAIENCRQLRVVSMDPNFDSSSFSPVSNGRSNRTCLALHGHNTEPFPLITKWKRRQRKTKSKSRARPIAKYDLEPKLPLPPKPITVAAAQEALQDYLAWFPVVVSELKDLLTPLARSHGNLIVTMVVTVGHMPLLMNYLCACAKAGVDTARIVVFCTDAQSFRMLVGMPSVTAFDLSPLWTSAALADEAEYGSFNYGRIMMSKIYSVHLVNSLGHDVLFQDVDLIPFKHDYIDYLVESVAKKRFPGFDLYMQYDHAAHHPLFAPYGGNSGLFFMKHNAKTMYLMSRLIRSGDLVLKTRSHQATLSIVLNDMASQYNIRVKVLSSESSKFPVGYHFHHEWEYMRDLVMERVRPYLFHMNWNNDKEMKRRFLQQLGYWFVKEECQVPDKAENSKHYSPQYCCVAKPTPICHYSDKPSKLRDCKTYPAVESNVSFW